MIIKDECITDLENKFKKLAPNMSVQEIIDNIKHYSNTTKYGGNSTGSIGILIRALETKLIFEEMKERSGVWYHRIKCVPTKDKHNSGFNLMCVYARKYDEESWTNLGIYDVVQITRNGSIISIDTTSSKGDFEIGTYLNGFRVLTNEEYSSIKFLEVKI